MLFGYSKTESQPNGNYENCQETRVMPQRLTDVDKLDAVLLYGIEGDGDVLEGVRLGLWTLVVS